MFALSVGLMGAMIQSDVTGSHPKIDRLPRLSWIHAVYAALALLLIAVLAFVTLRPVQVLPRGAEAPGFALVDEWGAPLTDRDGLGAITLYSVGTTRCAEPCPATDGALRAVQSRLAELDAAEPRVQLVTIALDPARDTPAALRDYAARLGADATRWRFATGDPAQVKQLVGGGFGIFYEPGDGGAMRFDPAIVLVDDRGLIRASYRTATPDVDIIMRDLRLLREEARNSSGPSRLVYEAAHVFVCYPQ